MQIDHSNIAQAVDLLVKGFPTRTPAFWEAGLAKMLASPVHHAGSHPVGYLLEANGKAVGVGLTAVGPSPRPAPNGTLAPKRINLASWYVDPDQRWRMPILLRRMMADKAAIYTDLTPTPEVQPLLKSLGFQPMNSGVTVVNLAAAALLPGAGFAVSGLRADDLGSIAEPDRTLVSDHLSYGCIGLQFKRDGQNALILMKPSYAKGIPVLQIVYCADNELVRNALPDIARFLIKKCHFCLVLENAPGRVPSRSFVNVVMPMRRKRFIKNSAVGPGTDFTYSELVFFDF